MVKVIPARIEQGRIIPSEPLPAESTIEGVSLVLSLKAPAAAGLRSGALAELRGILKGNVPASDEGLERDYADYLARKYE
jgi:hypothetical protein